MRVQLRRARRVIRASAAASTAALGGAVRERHAGAVEHLDAGAVDADVGLRGRVLGAIDIIRDRHSYRTAVAKREATITTSTSTNCCEGSRYRRTNNVTARNCATAGTETTGGSVKAIHSERRNPPNKTQILLASEAKADAVLVSGKTKVLAFRPNVAPFPKS